MLPASACAWREGSSSNKQGQQTAVGPTHRPADYQKLIFTIAECVAAVTTRMQC
jgi:hypothetical protein